MTRHSSKAACLSVATILALSGACTVRSNGTPHPDAGGSGIDAGGTEIDAAAGPDGGIDVGAHLHGDSGIYRLPDGAWVCGGDEIVLEHLPSRLILVVDRSSSMLDPADRTHTATTSELGTCAMTNARPGTGITYRTLWDDLGGAVSSVASARETHVEFGLTLFPGPGAITGAITGDAFCTARPPLTLVTPALNTGAAIATALTDPANAPLCAGGFTPTRDALEVAADALAGTSDGVLVLATDGAPNCGTGAPGCTCTTSSAFCGTLGTIGCLDDVATIDAIAALAARGIRTYVVGIPGTESYASALSAMATAGGTARATAPEYYRADDAAALTAALGTISDTEVSCRFRLAHAPPDRTNVNVLLDDAPTPQGADGWMLASDGLSIELLGASCDALRAGTVGRVQFLFGCAPLI